MEAELETKDLKRVIPTQQRVNYHQSQIGYQLQSQKLNLSSMDSAATESEYYTTNSSRSQSQNERKTKQQKKINKKQQQRRRSISFSNQTSKQTSRSQSSSKSKKRNRTPSPWPQSPKLNRYQQRKNNNNKKDLNKGISAIQQQTCKYWINGCCNQPTKCQFAHYRFGKIIQEYNKEFSNLKKINQDIRDGLIMVKISLYQLISEEELKNIIRSQDENMAREIEISYQNAKSYKKMKKSINQIKKNKIMSQNEKKISIRETAHDSIYHLQINNNELNAIKREEAINKKKAKREEKRVQKQLERQNQNLLQEKIKNLILQQNNASPKYSDDEIYVEEENKDHSDDASKEQQMIIENNNNKYMHIINQTSYNDVIDQYSNDIEDSSQQQDFPFQHQQSYEQPNEITEQEERDHQETTLKQLPLPTQIPQQVLINNYTQNNAALNQLLTQNNNNEQQTQIKDEQQNKSHDHNKLVQQYLDQMSPPSKKQQTKSNYQLFKELKSKSIREQTNDLINNPDLMDTTKSVDSQTTKEMELKFALNQLYDWKFICQQKLYTSSTTQNVFNIPNIQINKYDDKQLISYNTKTKDVDMMDIPSSCKLTIKEYVESDLKDQNIKNLIVIINKKIAEQIFNAYTVEEIHRQVQEYCYNNYNDDKQAKMNDMHAFLLSFAQALRKIVNLNFANEGTEITLNHAKHMELIPKFCKLESTLITAVEASNNKELYKIYIIKQNENPTPFYLKNKQIFN